MIRMLCFNKNSRKIVRMTIFGKKVQISRNDENRLYYIFINAIYTQFIKIQYNVFDKEDNNMSKRYDEYVNKMNNNFSTEVIPMIPNIDSKLEREIRDRAIIELIKMSISKGMELTYGDICLMIDNDPSEKEYENMKTEITPKTKQFNYRLLNISVKIILLTKSLNF